MISEARKKLYNSKAWKNCRNSYLHSVGGLCERCLRKNIYTAGEIVHHKIHLSDENCSKPEIALNFDNLECLCRKCHAEVHDEDVYDPKRTKRRYKVDSMGRVIIKTNE